MLNWWKKAIRVNPFSHGFAAFAISVVITMLLIMRGPTLFASAELNRALVSRSQQFQQLENTILILDMVPVLRYDPRHPRALFYSGLACLQHNDLYCAEDMLRLTAEIRKDDQLTLLWLGLTELMLGKTEDAIVLLKRAKAVPYLLNRGKRALDDGEIQTAQRMYETVLLLEPEDPEALVGSAIIRFEYLGQPEAARQALNKAISVNPDLVDAYVWLAILCVREGKSEEALRWLHRAEVIAPRSSRIARLYGIQLFIEGHFQEAVSRLEKALRGNYADDPELLYYLGISHRELGNPQLAVKYLNAALHNAPRNPLQEVAIRLGLADMYEMTKDCLKAMIEYQTVLKLDPSNQTAVSKLNSLACK